MTDLANLEREAQAAERRAVALKKFVEVAKDLGDDGLAEVIGLLSAQAGNGHETNGGQAHRSTNGNRHTTKSRPDAPVGRDAIRFIVAERPGVWTLDQLKTEMKDRGWYTSDKGVESAARRLCRINKEGRHLGPGRYKFFPQANRAGDAS